MEQRELSVRGLACVALVLACAACSRAPERDLFKEGEGLFLEGEYIAAAEVFKLRLIQDPNDAGAHFYLGTCYLAKKNWLGIAQGEIETALSLFERQGKVNPVPRFSAEYFEMICHLNQAKVYLILIDQLVSDPRQFRGVDRSAVIPMLLEKCIKQADLAEQVSPGNPDVVALRDLIRQMTEGVGSAPRPRSIPSFAT